MGEYLKELTEDLPKFIQESEVDETALPELENATVVQVSKEDKEEREGADEKSDLILQKNPFRFSIRNRGPGHGSRSPNPSAGGTGWNGI